MEGKTTNIRPHAGTLQRRQRDFDTHRIFSITVIDFSKKGEGRWVEDINYFQQKT